MAGARPRPRAVRPRRRDAPSRRPPRRHGLPRAGPGPRVPRQPGALPRPDDDGAAPRSRPDLRGPRRRAGRPGRATRAAPATSASSASAWAEGSRSSSPGALAGTSPSPTTGPCPTPRCSTGRARSSRATAGATSTCGGRPGGCGRPSPTKGVPHDVEEYPAAGHAFLNERHSEPWWAAADVAPRHAGRARAGLRARTRGGASRRSSRRTCGPTPDARTRVHQLTAPVACQPARRPAGSSTAPPRFHRAR